MKLWKARRPQRNQGTNAGEGGRARPSRSVLIFGCAGAGLVLLLGSMAGTSGARTPTGAGKSFVYEPVHALLIIKDKATSDYPSLNWNGFGRVVQKLKPSRVPVLLGRGGTVAVNINSNETSNGDETLTASGKEDACSGSWEGKREPGAIVVQVTQEGGGKLATMWPIPTGFASPNCGRLYDQFGGEIEAHATVGGEIGDRHLVLNIENKKTETSPDHFTQQTVSWDGRVVLDLK
jgi:hypothetical protein